MHFAIATVLSAGIGWISFRYLGDDALLAVVTGLVWLVTVRTLLALTTMKRSMDPRLWPAASLLVGLVVAAALIGVGPFLPITAELRAALQLLVLGTGFACGTVSMYSLLSAEVTRQQLDRQRVSRKKNGNVTNVHNAEGD